MAWFRAWYGNWNESDGVRLAAKGNNRKEVFAKAQEVANRTGKVVTIEEERAVRNGVSADYYEIQPEHP